MDSCDVLIAGGGPAGSSCAWALRSSGLRVVILDKSRFPRDKVCGGWVTPQVFQALEIDPREYAQGRTCQAITGFRISAMGSHEREIPYGRPVSYGIRRCEFDEYLLRRSGAHVCEGTLISKIERADDGWLINGAIHARLLVGAGGHFCPIARSLADTSETPVTAQEVEFKMDPGQATACAIRPESPEMYFCRDLQGYGWVFRKDDFLNIGLGRLDQHELPRHVNEFVRFLHTTGKISFALPRKMIGHAYFLFGRSGRKLVDEQVMLIGDAAGLAYVQSGEGIRPAVESGLLAAQVIFSVNRCYSRRSLEPYRELLQAAFGRENSRTIASRLPHPVRNSLGRLLLQTDWFCRRIVVEEWFLHQKQLAVGN